MPKFVVTLLINKQPGRSATVEGRNRREAIHDYCRKTGMVNHGFRNYKVTRLTKPVVGKSIASELFYFDE